MKLLERLICKAMQTDWSKERGTDLNRAVKLFLSDVNGLDGCVRSYRKEEKPVVIRKSNFFSLLNNSEDRNTLGPCNLVWEGGPLGEGTLRDVKSLFRNRTEGWLRRLITNFYRERSMKHVQ